MKTNGEIVKIVVWVPEDYADKVRDALGKAGAGIIGKYDYCSFTVKGVGRFKPLKGSKPAIGKVGKSEEVVEERIETVCPKEKMKEVFDAIKKVHPYEKPVVEFYPLLNYNE